MDLGETILDVSCCAVGEACLLAEFNLINVEVLRYRVKLSFQFLNGIGLLTISVVIGAFG